MELFDELLDKSIYFSFDRSGYKRHAREFEDEHFEGIGKVAIVTGANAGIGLAVTNALIQCGVKVYMLCRSKERGKKAIAEILEQTPKAFLKLCHVDVSEPSSVKAFIKKEDLPEIDILINNAGGMPDTLTKNSEGNEIVWASHVVGHYLLTEGLISTNKLAVGARIITVSSGGMYTQKLDLSDLNFEATEYNKYKAYANAKRAQVILNELFQEQYGEDYTFSCMHPGWANTGGVKTAMPWFHWWMEKRLRTVEEGADTIVWLALTQNDYPGGKFWFDRKAAPTHFRDKTIESRRQREELLQLLYTMK